MRFDWYQATIEEDPVLLIGTVSKLGHEVRANDSLAKRYRYRQGWDVHHNSLGVVAHVLAGGNGKNPHAFASSQATDAFADLVRNEWPDRHLVTRLDAAEDFNEAGAFDRIRPCSRRIAKRHRLSFAQVADDLNPLQGRTQYLGSPSSDYRVRLYEKGFEELGKLLKVWTKGEPSEMHQQVTSIHNELTGEWVKPEDWTRLEIQVRPRQEEGRRQAAYCTPEQAWGFTDWSKELAKEAMALELQRIVIRTKKQSADDEQLMWMCRQYGKMLSRLHSDLGDWQCVGHEIGQVIKRTTDNS